MAGFLFFFLFFVARDPPLFAVVWLGTFLAFLLSVGFACKAGFYWTRTFVLVTPERLELKTIVFGREVVRHYALSENSQARQHWEEDFESGGEMQGIDVETEEGEVHFGDALTQGELDWIEWRINQFLGKATEADGPTTTRPPRRTADPLLEGVPAEPLPRPEDTKVRIDEDDFETRIHLPNSVETRSFSGIGPAIFGLGWSSYFLFVIVQSWNRRHAEGDLVMCGLFAVLGLLFLLNGLSQLFGRRRLTITPEKITYRTSLFGIGPRLRLPTNEVISVGSWKLQDHPRHVIAPANRLLQRYRWRARLQNGCVIRTAERELWYGGALRAADAQWLLGEVARRIHAARV